MSNEVKSINVYQGNIPQSTTPDPTLYMSPLHTPVVTNLKLKGGTYKDFNGNTLVFNDIILDTVLINVSQNKRIVQTEISNVDGTVKEYIGLDDYQISINGIINGPNGHYPVDEVHTLHQLIKAAVVIEVESRYLANLDIFELVIKDFTYSQEAGGYSKQNFSISAISEKPVLIQMS